MKRKGKRLFKKSEWDDFSRGEGDPGETQNLWAILMNRLAQGLSVSEACRQVDIHRSRYYRMREDSSKNRPPLTVTSLLRGRVLELALEFPEWGCDRITYSLRLEGQAISSPSVQKILISEKLGKRKEREMAALHREEIKKPPIKEA
jgi:hypothetical protein